MKNFPGKVIGNAKFGMKDTKECNRTGANIKKCAIEVEIKRMEN